MMFRFDVIVAVGMDGTIGIDGNIPWKKPEDLRRFKHRTMGSTLLMGRATYDSIGRRELPGRKTVVLSRSAIPGAMVANSFSLALELAAGLNRPIWVVGGGQIYDEAMAHPDRNVLDLTLVTDYTAPSGATRTVFKPFVGGDLAKDRLEAEYTNEVDPTLVHRLYRKV